MPCFIQLSGLQGRGKPITGFCESDFSAAYPPTNPVSIIKIRIADKTDLILRPPFAVKLHPVGISHINPPEAD
jgi:hypothetical protein